MSNTRLWTSRVLITLTSLFLIFDASGKIFRATASVEGTIALGFTDALVVPLGILLLACTILYMNPRTSILGAILLTGWLGGAFASQIISGEGWVWFPIVFGFFVWLGLLLRDERLQVLFFRR